MEEQSKIPTYPLTGMVTVDGQVPDSAIAVKCHHVKGIDKNHPTTSSAFTDDSGKFQISTYITGDGIPEGEYIITFYWGRHDPLTMGYSGPDKLNGRYRNPEKSEIKITVKRGEKADLGLIKLTTK